MQPSTPDVVGAYWAHHRLSSGARAERLAAQDLFWARQEVADAMGGPLRRALQVLETRIAHPDADLLAVGAGPLEDLLTRTDVLADGEVARRCRGSQAWRTAASGVWLDETELRRVPASAPFLTASPV